MTAWVLETERLGLRPYTLDDEAALFEVFGDPEARIFYPRMVDPAQVRAWIEWNLRNYEEFGFGLWAVEIKESGAFIGDCGLTYQEVEGKQELEVGYHVMRSERGRGYATEAARACLNHGFTITSCSLICSTVDPANEPSKKVAARVHTDRRKFVKNGKPMLMFFTPLTAWAGSSVGS